jgi:hypothetical protein
LTGERLDGVGARRVPRGLYSRSVLFSPEAHERLNDETWNPGHVRSAIAEIVEDAEGHFDDGWTTHPRDTDAEGDGERRFRTIYLGGAAEFGCGRHTLWTGDLGTALYLADCLAGSGTVPLP